MLKIGSLKLKYPALLSPMAALTDISFRRLIDEIGGVGALVTEMISAEGVRRKNVRTLDMLKPFPSATPQFVQLFASRAEPLTVAVRYIENETPYRGIDINMGCPAVKITKRGAGAALLRDPDRVREIAAAVRRATDLPLSVKIRLGYDKENVTEIVKILEGEGVDAVTVHFRLKTEGYSQPARWEDAPGVRAAIRTVFIGNGDIETAQDGKRKLDLCDGIMIGRGALRNPLIFAELAGLNPVPDLGGAFSRLLELIEEHYDPGWRLSRLKAYTRFLVHHRSGSKYFRQRIYTADCFESAKLDFIEYARQLGGSGV
jgi:nifR3 family TIM-barrel protein